MSGIKRLLTTAIVAAFCTGPVQADVDLKQVFAGCAGRMSAEMERSWLLSTSDAERYETQRASFQTLLDAVVPQEEQRSVLIYRIETKIAHASLLATADFGVDPARAQRAQKIAQQHVASCERLLLGA
ncbi:MAG: hypothetical protein WBV78_12980 [Roseobacter sp.]